MSYLLDVNILIAAIWDNHASHDAAFEWLEGRSIFLCPLCELGFLRISTQTKGQNATMEDARRVLKQFRASRKATLISDDLDPLDSHPKTTAQVSDHYLANLAAKHGLKLATLDSGIKHPSVELIA